MITSQLAAAPQKQLRLNVVYIAPGFVLLDLSIKCHIEKHSKIGSFLRNITVQTAEFVRV